MLTLLPSFRSHLKNNSLQIEIISFDQATDQVSYRIKGQNQDAEIRGVAFKQFKLNREYRENAEANKERAANHQLLVKQEVVVPAVEAIILDSAVETTHLH